LLMARAPAVARWRAAGVGTGTQQALDFAPGGRLDCGRLMVTVGKKA
jgi:hypothetical protein